MTSDVDFLHELLKQAPHSTRDVLRACRAADRPDGMMVHSRAADLRRRLAAEGRTVVCQVEGVYAATKRPRHVYRLVDVYHPTLFEAAS